MMKKIFFILLTAFLFCESCIENPLSYPRLAAEITAFELEGQKSLTIDASTRTVTVILKETADITSLKVKKYEYTAEAKASMALPEVLDLSSPLQISYTTYPDQIFEWTIKAEQPIERYVRCDNMIGDAEFDLARKEIIAYFPETQQLSAIRFTKMKLEPQGAVADSTFGHISIGGNDMIKAEKLTLPMTLDCVLSRDFTILYKGEVSRWKFTAVHKQINLEVVSVNAWCYKAEITAAFKGSGSPKIEYRESSSQEWIELDCAVNGTQVTASVEMLDEGTEYVARVVNGDEASEEFVFSTESAEQLPNMSFDEWHQGDPGGYTWYPMPEGVAQIWGCANAGVNMMSAVNSTRPEYSFVAKKGGAAVRLESVKVFGMFAAGNIFTGSFLKATISGGAGAELDWGTPFTSRPYSLKGYYSYSPKLVDNASDQFSELVGKPDNAQIMVFLTDWEEPFRVITASQTFVDLENDPHIIALGAIETDQDTGGKYQEFECVLEYRDTQRKPKYIVAVASSSRYGDYFTGAQGSVMYVDEWELIYR